LEAAETVAATRPKSDAGVAGAGDTPAVADDADVVAVAGGDGNGSAVVVDKRLKRSWSPKSQQWSADRIHLSF